MDTTRELAGFVSGLEPDDLSPSVVETARMLFADALACALAGYRGEETGQLESLATALGRSGDSTVIGDGRQSLAAATLMNGYLITAVTMCDVHRPTLTHVTPEVVPAALAVAEQDGCSGRALLTAIAAGCEVTTRVGVGLDPRDFRSRGWHGPGVTGPFGAAAAVGRLRNFDTETMARALGLAGSQSAGTFAAWGTPTVKFHQCRAALSGLMAGLLAEQGFVATTEILTASDGGLLNTYSGGGRPELIVADLGAHWEFQQISLRLWPSATALQGVITALFTLARSHEPVLEDIERVRLRLDETACRMHGGFSRYSGKFEALLSAHFVAAAFLRYRTITLDQFEPEVCDDPVLREFARERVEIIPDPTLAGGQAVAEVETGSGQRLTGRCDAPLGAPGNPVTMGQIEEKLRASAGPRLPDRQVDRIVDAINGLETLASMKELSDLLIRD